MVLGLSVAFPDFCVSGKERIEERSEGQGEEPERDHEASVGLRRARTVPSLSDAWASTVAVCSLTLPWVPSPALQTVPGSLPGSIPELRARRPPWAFLGIAPKRAKKKTWSRAGLVPRWPQEKALSSEGEPFLGEPCKDLKCVPACLTFIVLCTVVISRPLSLTFRNLTRDVLPWSRYSGARN